jgi:glycosyltransferase involved in cell wall biosynthesis
MTGAGRLRILNVAHIRWWSALAHYAHAAAVALERRGHRVLVAGTPGTPYLQRCAAAGLSLFGADAAAGEAGAPPAGGRPSIAAVRGLIRTGGLDAMIVHTGPGHADLALARLGMRTRTLLVRARPEIRPPRGHLFNRVLHRSMTDRILLSGDFMKEDHYGGWFLDSGRLAVVHGGVDVEHYSKARWEGEAAEIRRRMGMPPRSTLIGLIGRLSPVKGHRTALEALLPLMAVDQQLHLLFAGGESQIRWVDLAEEVPGGLLPRVHYIGQVPDAAPYMAACDMVLIPSLGSEAVCRVAMECLALGIPVAGSGVNVIPEVIRDGETGWIAPAGDPRALRQAVEEMIGAPDETRRRSERGRAAACRLYSWEALGARLEALLLQAMAGEDWDKT